jgi:hypothetical protein
VDRSTGDSIRLTVPATSVAVRIARAGAAALATRAGFTYREVEALRLAVGEAAALLAPDIEGDGTLVVVYDVEDAALSINLHLVDRAPRMVGIPGLAAAVLDASVDTWNVTDDGRGMILRKSVTDSEDDD